MKSFVGSLVLLSIALALFNFELAEKPFMPPGTVLVDDGLYFDKTEVTNVAWREYEHWCKEKYGVSSLRYWNALPDTTVWRKVLSYSESYVENYYRNPMFDDYPIIGISYEQAVNFCKWRTDKVRKMLEEGEFGRIVLPQTLNYRLPDKAEWEAVARVSYKDKFQRYVDRQELKRTMLHNLVSDSIPPAGYQSEPNPDATITAPVMAYFPNELGIFNLIGNVAEMTATKGVAKGGSWKDRSREVTVDRDFIYERPAAWLGFRCVCEVK